MKNRTVIDELTACAIFIFMTSCILSFLSIRSKKQKSIYMEKIADVIFLVGLFILFTTTILITLDIIK